MKLKLANRWLQIGWRVALCAVLFSYSPAHSQVLTVAPGCGMAGSQVQVTGSGWAEPSPVCEYIFYFDGAEFAPRQPDGLFGPPNQTPSVPAGATPGEHTVRVELRLTDSSATLLQCRQVPFRIVETILDPWNGGITISGGTIKAAFDPTDVCDVENCSKIVMVQVKRPLGEKSDGTTRPLTHTEQGWPPPNAATMDTDLTAAGYSVDYVVGEADPYYNGDDAADGIQQGMQGQSTADSIISDTPRRSDAAYPSDIVKIILDFEVGAFCAQGQGKGTFLGKTTWRWERSAGAGSVLGTITSLGSSRDAPSAEFTAALNLWIANHNFTLPMPGASTAGGQPCN